MPESSPAWAASPAGPNDRLGLVFALAAAAGLGLAVALSRLAYEGGTNALTVATTRALLTAVLVGVWCLVAAKPLRLPPGLWWPSAGLGCLVAMMFYGNIAAVQYIPVGLAALLFYTYPPMVALASAVLLRERPPLAKLAALAVAFAGLAIMLGVSAQSADWRGMVLSLLAAAATAWNAIWLARRMHGVDMVVITLHMALVGAVVLCGLLVLDGGPRWATTTGGWFGHLATALTQSLSVPFYFLGIARIGALKSAMMSNIQPVVSIGAAWLLFGDLLGGAQFLGGALVLGAIVAMQRADARAP